jgi:hypothetical protein
MELGGRKVKETWAGCGYTFLLFCSHRQWHPVGGAGVLAASFIGTRGAKGGGEIRWEKRKKKKASASP